MVSNLSIQHPLEDWKGFYDELQQETPRAAVIIAAAFMDGWLVRLLQSVMIDDSKVVGSLLGDERNADCPLSSFSARIKTAYCLGLLTKNEFHDLNLIRKIRNRCAHRLHGFSFDEEEIVGWCNSLKIPKPIISVLPHFPKNHRSMFLVGVSILATKLSLKAIGSKEK